MAFFAWLKENSEGCDYYIGCGERLFPLKSVNKTDAEKEAQEVLRENATSERTFSECLVLEMTSDQKPFIKVVEQELKESQKNEELNRKRKQLADLKKELGEN